MIPKKLVFILIFFFQSFSSLTSLVFTILGNFIHIFVGKRFLFFIMRIWIFSFLFDCLFFLLNSLIYFISFNFCHSQSHFFYFKFYFFKIFTLIEIKIKMKVSFIKKIIFKNQIINPNYFNIISEFI